MKQRQKRAAPNERVEHVEEQVRQSVRVIRGGSQPVR